MAFASGSVVLGPDVLKLFDPDRAVQRLDAVGPRPFLVVSNEQRPFSPDEYTVMTITTTEREIAMPITDDVIVDGALNYESFLNPWTVTPLQSEYISRRVAQIDDEFVEQAWDEFWRYHG